MHRLGSALGQPRKMKTSPTHQWNGIGKWLSFAAATMLIVTAIPMIFVHVHGAAAGWNIFLGLLLFGAIVSGNKGAPALAIVISILLGIRFVVVAILQASIIDLVGALIMFGLIAVAAYDLRKQA